MADSDWKALYEKERDLCQTLVDRACYYRNLSIRLGARPEQMRNDYDRALALNPEFVKDESFSPDQVTVSDEIREVEEYWEREAVLEDQLEHVQEELRLARAQIDQIVERDLGILAASRTLGLI